MIQPVVLTSRIPQVIATSSAKASAAVHKTAFDIEAGCKVRSRVDLDQMRSGWQTEILGPYEAVVYNSVEHVLHNEYGTDRMTAQPMLTPSHEEATDPFVRAIGQIYR